MSVTNKMLNKIDVDIENLRGGLQPENLEYWYRKITDETIEILLRGFKTRSISHRIQYFD